MSTPSPSIPRPPRGKCALAWAKSHLDPEDREALDRLVYEMRHLTNYQVADLLAEEGIDTDYQVIQRHRIGRCRTCTREADHGQTVQAS